MESRKPDKSKQGEPEQNETNTNIQRSYEPFAFNEDDDYLFAECEANYLEPQVTEFFIALIPNHDQYMLNGPDTFEQIQKNVEEMLSRLPRPAEGDIGEVQVVRLKISPEKFKQLRDEHGWGTNISEDSLKTLLEANEVQSLQKLAAKKLAQNPSFFESQKTRATMQAIDAVEQAKKTLNKK